MNTASVRTTGEVGAGSGLEDVRLDLEALSRDIASQRAIHLTSLGGTSASRIAAGLAAAAITNDARYLRIDSLAVIDIDIGAVVIDCDVTPPVQVTE